jgi:hypothetical protein
MTNGALLFAIGVGHELIGLLAMVGVNNPWGHRNVLAEIGRAGVIGGIGVDPVRAALFWFFFFGLVLLMLGSLLHGLERAGQPIAASVGWQLLALVIAGGLLIPASGFWLVVPVGVRIVWRARAARFRAAERAAATAPATR